MEEETIVKEQPSADASGNSARSKLQRYALRSSSAKSKEFKPDASDCSNPPSELKRGRSSPSVTRSVGVLDFSGKNRSSSAKPPRRLSIPVKASATPSPKHVVGNTTPISETRARRSGNAQGPQTRIQTPVSEIFRSTNRAKFSLISSPSYWLNQIKLFESAAKHSISLGLFKLALEAGCEPFQKMQDELKSYVQRYQDQLAELGEPVKEVLQSYNLEIEENIEQSQVSESISQVPEEGTRSSDDEVVGNSSVSYSTMDTGKLKPKYLDIDATQVTPPVPTTDSTKPTESTKKETFQKKNTGSSLRENLRTNSANSRLASDSGIRRSVKKFEKPSKPEANKKSEIKKHGKNSGVKEALVSPTRAADNVPNKENMDVGTTDDGLTEVM